MNGVTIIIGIMILIGTPMILPLASLLNQFKFHLLVDLYAKTLSLPMLRNLPILWNNFVIGFLIPFAFSIFFNAFSEALCSALVNAFATTLSL